VTVGRTETDREVLTSQDVDGGCGETGHDGVEAKRNHELPFFYVESAVLSAAHREDWTRDELLVYLLHCRGYSARCRCSLMGENAARVRLGLTKKPWEQAQASLELRGRLSTETGKGSKRPRTCIAGAGETYSGAAQTGERPKAIDGHRYRDVASKPLVKAPWTLIDGSTDGSAPSLADLRSRDAILLLLAIYGFARADGVIPLREAWVVEREGAGVGVGFSTAARADFLGDPMCLESAAAELLDSGLLYTGVEGAGGKWVVHLAHPMAPGPSAARAVA